MKKYRFSKTEFIVHKAILKRLRQIKFYFVVVVAPFRKSTTRTHHSILALSHVRITYGI